MNNKKNYNLKYMANDQVKAFDDFKNKSSNKFENLAPTNKMEYNSKNNFQGARKTPFFSIDKRYVAKNLTKKEEK